MRFLPVRLLLSLLVVITFPVLAHDVTLTGISSFASLDGSASDHDGVVNGIFTVSDGDLIIEGAVTCNDVGPGNASACPMAFVVSGNLTINAGGALYAENRTGSGSGGSITLTVGGDLLLSGNAIISSAGISSGGSNGGNVQATVGGAVGLSAGSTVDAGAANGNAGNIAVASNDVVVIHGNVLSGPSRSLLGTRLTGSVLAGGDGNQSGGDITISSSTFVEPAIVVGSAANIVSQSRVGTGSVTLDGCGIDVRGLVASVTDGDSGASVVIRSGKDLSIDGRDLGATGTRMGRIRADSLATTAVDNHVDLFASETITLSGPSGSLFLVTANPVSGSNVEGGKVRTVSTGDGVSASANAIDAGRSSNGSGGGTIAIAATADVHLNTAVLRAVGGSGGNPIRHGGTVTVRSHSGDIHWTNGTGDVRPVGSSSGLSPASQGSIELIACGTIDTTGSSFPVNGTATAVHPASQTGVCSPAAPSLPDGAPPLVTCNTPPVANETSATTNEDTTITIALSGSDADGDALTFSVVSGPSNGSLGPIVSTGSDTATVDYSPDADFNGSDSFVFRANDGNGGTGDATATITVNAVNDSPSFLAGPTVSVLEDSGPQTYASWATLISAGPADESGQTVTFTVTNDNNALFSVQPAVASDGTLTFTPAVNAYGSATLTVVASDNGGTGNGGSDTSSAQSSTITVDAVNDQPSFTAGGDVTVSEDSGAYSATWATAISAGPNEGSQTVSFVVSNDNAALFASQPTIDASGVLTFTPAADAHGSATVTAYLTDDGGPANGGEDTSPSVSFTITVNSVNDAPSFTGGGDVTLNEDSGAYAAAWATSVSAGPMNESGQAVTFNITGNSNPSLFASGPSLSSAGVLSFTLAADVSGSSSITVTLSDDGGTANGGSDTSAAQNFSITINAVNDAPSFVAGENVTVNEDSGAYSASWATAISAGPNEGGQIVAFNTSGDNSALFSVQPSIDAAGVLTFAPAPNAFGFATVTVFAQDDGGTANGGIDTSASVQFVITVNGINDPPTAGNDSWETEGNTELRVDLASGTTPFVGDATTSGTGVLDNDSDSVEGDPFSITGVVGCADTTAPFDCAVTGGAVSLQSNGSFSFKPAPGATSASFQYTVTDQPAAGAPASATGTVTITMHDMIWYVNAAAAAGGNGTSASPFDSFASLNGSGDVDGSGDYIFVHNDGVVSGGISVEIDQKLWGQGVGLIIPRNLNGNGAPAVLVPAGGRSTIDAPVGNAVNVTSVTGADVAGLRLLAPAGNGVDVSSQAASLLMNSRQRSLESASRGESDIATSLTGLAASATIRHVEVAVAGQEGIDINAFSPMGTTVHIDDTTVTSTGDGIDLLAMDGIVTFSYTNGGLLRSLTGAGITLDGSNADVLYVTGLDGWAVDGVSVAGVDVTDATFDANPATSALDLVSFGSVSAGSAANPVTTHGLILTNVHGDLAFASLEAFSQEIGVDIHGMGLFTGAAGTRVTSAAGRIASGTYTALSVVNATIGPSDITFDSISAAGGPYGIRLDNTGNVGGLRVLGSGSAGSGGSITNITLDAVRLVSSRALLTDMSLVNSGESHIDATDVDGLTLIRVNTDFSNDHGIVGTNVRNLIIQGGLYDRGGAGSVIAGKHGVFITNLLGTSSVSGTTFRRSNTIQFRVSNTTATNAFPGAPDTLTVSDTTWDTHTSPFAGDHLSVDSGTGGNFRVATNAAGGINSFTGAGVALQATASGSGSIDVSATGLKSTDNTAGIVIATTGTSSGTYSIFGNKTANGTGFSNSGALAISVVNTGTGSLNGTIDDNSVLDAPSGSGMQIIQQGSGTVASSITNNVITGNIANNGIRAQSLAGAGTMALNIHNNTVSLTSAAALDGISIESGGSGVGHTNTVCLNMSNNVSTSSVSGQEGYRLRQRAGTTFNLQNFAGSGTSTTDVASWVNTTKSNTGTVDVVIATTFSAASGSCPTP